MTSPVAAVMVHVASVPEALAWYQAAFPTSIRTRTSPTGFECLMLDGVQIEVVPADEKVSSGAAGSVVYWMVGNLENALAHLTGIGASLYRGPMKIERDLAMCQVLDPWGNCIGLRGP